MNKFLIFICNSYDQFILKTFLLILILFLTTEGVLSQVVFCPPGAKWNYTWSYSFSPWPQAAYNDQITYVGDTIIGVDTVKKLHHNFFSYECLYTYCNPTYLKQKGDTIFMLNSCNVGGWQILYNFAATSGSTWQNILKRTPTSASTYTYQIAVISSSIVTINGLQLKQLVANYHFYRENTLTSTGVVTITERLGASRYLFNFRNLVATDCNYISRNLCYSDSSFGLHQYTEFPCDFSNPVDLTETPDLEYGLEIYPNPTSDFIQFNKLPSGTYSFNLMDFSGKLILSSVIGPEQQIDIREQEKGIYFLELKEETLNQTFRTKIIKQ